MGRLFSVSLTALLSALLLCAGLALADARAPETAQPVFFRMIFPQLMPEWAWNAPQERATPDEALPFDGQTLGEAVCL